MPRYVEDEETERVRAEMGNKRSHKTTIPRDLLLFDQALKSGLRRSELAILQARDISGGPPIFCG